MKFANKRLFSVKCVTYLTDSNLNVTPVLNVVFIEKDVEANYLLTGSEAK